MRARSGSTRLGTVHWAFKRGCPGKTAPNYQPADAPPPDDKELIGRVQNYYESVPCHLNAETRVVARPKRVGYVRGAVRPAAGLSATDYYVLNGNGGGSTAAKGGEFVSGPYPLGKMTFRLQRAMEPNGPMTDFSDTREVEIRDDRVAHVELVARAATKEDAKPARAAKLCGDEANFPSDWQDAVRMVEGTVYLPDGHAPARGAQIAIACRRNPPQPIENAAEVHLFIGPKSFGWESNPTSDERSADFAGHFQLVWNVGGSAETPDTAMIAAWLPGRYGPALVPATNATSIEGLRIVLPPSAMQRGRITLGGKEFSELKSELHVMAVREGSGPFNRLFQQYVSADPEGNFELPALVPGEYQIQATLDNIWLSPSVRVTVGADAAPAKADYARYRRAGRCKQRDRS